MPVIVVGADVPAGRRITEALAEPGRDVRAFVSDPRVGSELKRLGVKVAVGDVSDESHIQAAASNCFTAVMVAAAASDDRERSFASTPSEVLAGWAHSLVAARVKRVIWIADEEAPSLAGVEVVRVSPGQEELETTVAGLDEAGSIGPRPSG